MLEKVDFIEERYPSLLDEYRTRLTDKVTELLGSEKVDDARIATEILFRFHTRIKIVAISISVTISAKLVAFL